jgi:hypothetical protein
VLVLEAARVYRGPQGSVTWKRSRYWFVEAAKKHCSQQRPFSEREMPSASQPADKVLVQ